LCVEPVDPMKPTPLVVAGAIVLAGFASGCASRSQKPVYNPSQTGTIIRQEKGEIVAVRDVIIKAGNPSAIYGGPGRRIGNEVGRAVATGSVTGVIASVGGAIGGEIGSLADDKAGEEIHIRLERSEEVIIVVQERGSAPLAPGQKVNVQTGSSISTYPRGILSRGSIGGVGGSVRVVPVEYLHGSPVAINR